jgi:transcriptional regulator with XRE-family HTH domain
MVGSGPDYSARIKALRARLGLTQVALADLLGVSFVSVNRWENGQTRPTGLARRRILELEEPRPRQLREGREAYRAEPDELVLSPAELRALAERLLATNPDAVCHVQLELRPWSAGPDADAREPL